MGTISASLPGQDQTGFIESCGQDVRYRVRGDGPPLLMIHGIGASLELWHPFEDELGEFQTITVDPPGAGRSSTPRGRFTMRQFARVMDDLLEHLGVQSAHVLGLSLGGMIAQELAHQSPRRVEKLVLVSTNWGVGSVPTRPRTLAMIASPARFYSREHYRRIAPALYGDQILSDPALLDEHMEIRRRCKPSVRGYFIQLAAASTWSSLPWLRSLDVPILVIAGSDDQIVPVANGRLLAGLARHGRAEIIDGGSHLCLLQEAQRTSRLVTDFLYEV